jgi:outer membrane protein assembly factor BamD
VAPPPVAPIRISKRLWSASGGDFSATSPVFSLFLSRQAQGALRPPVQRAPARLASRAPGVSIAAGAVAAGAAPPPDAEGPAQAAQESNAAASCGVQWGRREVDGRKVDACKSTVVDADTSLTYHRFFMSPRFRHLSLLIALSCAIGLGCAESDDEGRPVTYSLTAKQNYEKGMAELKDESYAEAKKYFQFVKQKFPFSKYAVMAELALADTEFAQGNYTESLETYKSFARLHPTHEKVEDGYVAFRICEGYYKDMPEDVWIMPPSYEKDQSAVNDAARELGDFHKKFPDSPYAKKVADMRKEVLKRLVDHEVYVAIFYLKNDHPKAAAMRIEGAIKKYPGSGREPELLYSLGETYLHMDDPLRAKETFQRVVNEYGTAPQARRSELYLEYITRRFGPNPQPKQTADATATAHG